MSFVKVFTSGCYYLITVRCSHCGTIQLRPNNGMCVSCRKR